VFSSDLLWIAIEESKARELLERMAKPESASTWAKSSAGTISESDRESLMKDATWDKSKDGNISTKELSPAGVAIVAGFTDGNRAPLDDAHGAVLTIAGAKGASRAQYLTTVEVILRAQAGAPLRRVLLLDRHEGKTTILNSGFDGK